MLIKHGLAGNTYVIIRWLKDARYQNFCVGNKLLSLATLSSYNIFCLYTILNINFTSIKFSWVGFGTEYVNPSDRIFEPSRCRWFWCTASWSMYGVRGVLSMPPAEHTPAQGIKCFSFTSFTRLAVSVWKR